MSIISPSKPTLIAGMTITILFFVLITRMPIRCLDCIDSLVGTAAETLGYKQYSTSPARIIVVKAEVAPYLGKETILGVTLFKNQAFVAVFRSFPLRLVGWAKEFTDIRDLSWVDLPGQPTKGIVIRDFYDNRLGSFEQVMRVHVYRFTGPGPLTESWSGIESAVAYWHELWSQPEGRQIWFRYSENASIDMMVPGIIRVVNTKTRAHGEAPPTEFPAAFITDRSWRDQLLYRYERQTDRFLRINE